MVKLKAYIFIDASNIHYYLKSKGWRVDWLKFKTYYETVFQNPSFFYYEGITSKGQYFDTHRYSSFNDFIDTKEKKENYFKLLKHAGYKVQYKPINRVYDNTSGQFKHKCNFDVELTIDAIDNIDNYDVFTLVSGDGDFLKLIRFLKSKKKKTIIIAPKERLSQNLKKAANEVIYLNQIKENIIQK
jgi:uncharacterized LabA/DUF88 family protein